MTIQSKTTHKLDTYPLGEPDIDRPPMRNNVFNAARTANSKLVPMFGNYTDKGCMLPAVACFTGAPGRSFLMFQHENCVDEVATVFAARGAPFPLGAVFVGTREHFVNIPLEDSESPTNYVIMSITQRQWEKSEPQRETLTIVCEQCQEPLLSHSYDCDIPDSNRHPNDYAPFATLPEGVVIVDKLNANPDLLVCKECGFKSRPFPIDDWGWNNYTENAKTVSSALIDYQAEIDR